MSEREQGTRSAVELLLREPEIVAWLDDYRNRPSGDEAEPDEDGDPPQAA